jgi:hypothetical protein
MPEKDNDGKVYFGRYISGFDPYMQDGSSGDSYGSFFILDRYTDQIVCEYFGRPLKISIVHEQLRRALMFFNARCNYENAIKGAFDYFEKMNSLYLLCDTPENIYDKIADKAVLNRKKGTPANQAINSRARELILEWLYTPTSEESNIMNMHSIKSIGLLDELIGWNIKGNYDRVSSLGMLMILRENMHRIPTKRHEVTEARNDDIAAFLLSAYRGKNVYNQNNYNKV